MNDDVNPVRGVRFFGGVERVMVRSASSSPSSSSLIPRISPVFACGAFYSRGTSGHFTGRGSEGDGKSVEDAEEE